VHMLNWITCLMNRIQLEDYSMPDPCDEKFHEACWRARYAPIETLSRTDMFYLLAAADAYCTLATHPAGTEAMIKKLRALRKAISG
jgi:hypothetical protein